MDSENTTQSTTHSTNQNATPPAQEPFPTPPPNPQKSSAFLPVLYTLAITLAGYQIYQTFFVPQSPLTPSLPAISPQQNPTAPSITPTLSKPTPLSSDSNPASAPNSQSPQFTQKPLAQPLTQPLTQTSPSTPSTPSTTSDKPKLGALDTPPTPPISQNTPPSRTQPTQPTQPPPSPTTTLASTSPSTPAGTPPARTDTAPTPSAQTSTTQNVSPRKPEAQPEAREPIPPDHEKILEETNLFVLRKFVAHLDENETQTIAFKVPIYHRSGNLRITPENRPNAIELLKKLKARTSQISQIITEIETERDQYKKFLSDSVPKTVLLPESPSFPLNQSKKTTKKDPGNLIPAKPTTFEFVPTQN